MAAKPKPAFWVLVVLVVAGLIAASLYRAGIIRFSKLTDHPQPPAQQTKNEVEILFYTSSAKKTWVDEMVKKFNAAQNRVGDAVIRVKAFHVNSGDSLDELKNGKIRPDLWSPGDESWLDLAAAHWRDVLQKPLFDSYTPVVNIPLVIAMWEPMARVLGYPNAIGWKDVERVAADPKGWLTLGHPEWGKFRWGHAHPDANSGFLTIISEVYAALGKTTGITPNDLKNPEVISFLTSFEGAVEHYGLSNSWIDDLMHIKGPAYLSATVQYENTIIETNEKHQNKPFKLVAIYPKEGCFWTRHPTAVLKESWVTPEKQEASQKFLTYLLSPESQQRAMEMGLRPISKDIEIKAPFDEAHGVLAQISSDRMFQVPEEAVLKRIRDLWEDVKVPATVVLVLDRSGSMKGTPMDNAKTGAIQFIKQMKPRDMIMVSVFNNTVSPLIELCSVRECGETAVSRIEGIFADGGTALYDAVLTAFRQIRELKSKDPKRRYAVLLLSDGQDTASVTNRHDFLDSLPKGEEFDAPKIYSIAYGPDADKNLLSEISNRTNARIFVSTPEEIGKTYKELSANF